MKTLLLLALLVSSFAPVVDAQTYSLAPVARQQFFNASGFPLAGGKLYTYAAGTSTPLATYQNSTGTANANPVILDSGGFANLWLGTAAYKITAQNSAGVQQWSVDNIPGTNAALTALTGANGAALVNYTAAGTGAVTRTVASKLGDTVSVKDFGAVGNGVTDDNTAFQAAANAVNAAGGGAVFIPDSAGCYIVTNVLIYSNTTVYSDSQSTCVQVKAGVGVGGAAFTNVNSPATMVPASNIHYRNFTIDGNQANVTGVPAGSGGNSDITLWNCTNCTVESMYLKNAAVDAITIGCNATAPHYVGDNVQVLNTVATLSRRNNISLICGTNTSIVGGELSYANGPSPSNLRTGLDVEPDVAGQLVSGLTMTNVSVHDNLDGGILLQGKFDDAPVFNFVNLNVYNNGTSPIGSNGAAFYAVNFNVPAFADKGQVNIVGGSYASVPGTPGSILVTAFKSFTATGEKAFGGVRGILTTGIGLVSTLGPGYAAGSSADISCTAPSTCIFAGVQLGNNNPAPADLASIQGLVTGTINSPYTTNGISLNLTEPASFIKSLSGAGSILKVGNTSASGSAALEIDNDVAAGSWRLFSPGSGNGSNSGCLSLHSYTGTTFNYGAFNFCPGGGLAFGKNNGTVAASHSLDVKDNTATTGVTQVWINDGAGQAGTAALNVPGKANFGSVTVGGVAGFTGTKTAGTCVLTIASGVITGVSGC